MLTFSQKSDFGDLIGQWSKIDSNIFFKTRYTRKDERRVHESPPSGMMSHGDGGDKDCFQQCVRVRVSGCSWWETGGRR